MGQYCVRPDDQAFHPQKTTDVKGKKTCILVRAAQYVKIINIALSDILKVRTHKYDDQTHWRTCFLKYKCDITYYIKKLRLHNVFNAIEVCQGSRLMSLSQRPIILLQKQKPNLSQAETRVAPYLNWEPIDTEVSKTSISRQHPSTIERVPKHRWFCWARKDNGKSAPFKNPLNSARMPAGNERLQNFSIDGHRIPVYPNRNKALQWRKSTTGACMWWGFHNMQLKQQKQN